MDKLTTLLKNLNKEEIEDIKQKFSPGKLIYKNKITPVKEIVKSLINDPILKELLCKIIKLDARKESTDEDGYYVNSYYYEIDLSFIDKTLIIGYYTSKQFSRGHGYYKTISSETENKYNTNLPYLLEELLQTPIEIEKDRFEDYIIEDFISGNFMNGKSIIEEKMKQIQTYYESSLKDNKIENIPEEYTPEDLKFLKGIVDYDKFKDFIYDIVKHIIEHYNDELTM